VSDAGQLQVLIGQHNPGDKVTLSVQRDGKSMNLPITLEEMGSRRGEISAKSSEEHGKARWGIGITNVTPELREQLQLPSNIHGAVVSNVEPGSPADNAGLARGDVIVEVDRHQVENAGDVKQQLGNIPKGQDALLLVWSNGGNSFRVLHSGDEA